MKSIFQKFKRFLELDKSVDDIELYYRKSRCLVIHATKNKGKFSVHFCSSFH